MFTLTVNPLKITNKRVKNGSFTYKICIFFTRYQLEYKAAFNTKKVNMLKWQY